MINKLWVLEYHRRYDAYEHEQEFAGVFDSLDAAKKAPPLTLLWSLVSPGMTAWRAMDSKENAWLIYPYTLNKFKTPAYLDDYSGGDL